jgi:hypothetical protein
MDGLMDGWMREKLFKGLHSKVQKSLNKPGYVGTFHFLTKKTWFFGVSQKILVTLVNTSDN